MFFIIFICGIAFVMLFFRSPRSAAAVMLLLLLLLVRRWMPAAGIDPQAAVNGTFGIVFMFVLLVCLADRIRP